MDVLHFLFLGYFLGYCGISGLMNLHLLELLLCIFTEYIENSTLMVNAQRLTCTFRPANFTLYVLGHFMLYKAFTIKTNPKHNTLYTQND